MGGMFKKYRRMVKSTYTIEAKPTVYNRRLYRSRLEARWACMFDFIGYDFEYEPEPFKTWSPDFLLQDWGGIYLEIKPYGLWDDQLIQKILPYVPDNRCGLIGEDLLTEETAFYPGKYFNNNRNDGLILKDITVPYHDRFDKWITKQLWIEAANKVMYNPGK
jgi:hypothetical protein